MPSCLDYRMSIQLICECGAESKITKTSHEVTLENHTTQTLFDVSFSVSIANWGPASRLNISKGSSQAASGSASHNIGSISPMGSYVKSAFELTPVGNGARGEYIETTADWALSANSPLTGIPPSRFSRHCNYPVSVM